MFSVCVRPSDIPHAVERLAGTGVAVGTVIGFPHGTTSTAAKVAEVRQALADGASEFDMVINIGALRSGFDDQVVADIAAVVDAASGHITKVILETALLDDEQIARAATMGVTDPNRIYSIEDMAKGDVMFAATGVTSGAMLRGVRRFPGGAYTHSIVMRSKSGTVRYVEGHHNFARKPSAFVA